MENSSIGTSWGVSLLHIMRSLVVGDFKCLFSCSKMPLELGLFLFPPLLPYHVVFSSCDSQDICHRVRNKREEECNSHAGPMLAKKKAEAFSDPVPTPSPEAPATFHLGLVNQQHVLWLLQQTGRLRMQVLPLTCGPPSRNAFPHGRCS